MSLSFLKIWPEIIFKKKRTCQTISCDVDLLSEFKNGFYRNLRGVASDFFKTKNSKLFYKKLKTRITAWSQRLKDQKYYQNVLWMSEFGKQLGESLTFYLLVNKTHALDGNYNVDHKDVHNLIEKLIMDGHTIGLHFSYNAFNDWSLMELEANKFRGLMRNVSGSNNTVFRFESRQHYLRWDPKLSPKFLNDLGVEIDSTLGFADRVGFRCGTSREYPMYDIHASKTLNLRQRPLIVMETSLFSDNYDRLGYTDVALEKMKDLKSKSLSCGGSFTCLWHNSSFPNSSAYKMYAELLLSKPN